MVDPSVSAERAEPWDARLWTREGFFADVGDADTNDARLLDERPPHWRDA